MSVWRRLQRVGKKAAQFEFTLSLQHCTLQCNKQYTPGNLVVVFTRRSRRHSSKSFKCSPSMQDEGVYNYVWPMPDNMVFKTTLYRGEKAIQFEDKAWTCQIEDIGGSASGESTGVGRGRLLLSGPSVRRRVLATRQIDLSEFASGTTCQQNLCLHLRMATKNMLKASITFTLNSVIVKEGEATDEDMISVASLMSLSRAGSFNLGSGLTLNDMGAFSPPALHRFASGRFARFPGSLTSASGSVGNFDTDGGIGGAGAIGEVASRLGRLEMVGQGGDKEATLDSRRQSQTGEDKRLDDKASGMSPVNRKGYQVSVSTMSLSNSGDPISSRLGKLPKGYQGAVLPTQSSQDLLAWCQEVTKGYPGFHITNLTTSFQSGLAFCAILHHFFPDKIQYPSQTTRTQASDNCRLAFEVAANLGVPRLLDPAEITSLSRPPDLLSMMTYLHQIRTRCCPEATSPDGGSNRRLDETDLSEVPVKNGSPFNGTRDELTVDTTSPVTGSNRAPPQLTLELTEEQVAEACGEGRETNGGQKQSRQSVSVRTDHMLAKAQCLLQETRAKTTKKSQSADTDALLPPLVPTAGPRKPVKSGSPTTMSTVEQDGDGTIVGVCESYPAGVGRVGAPVERQDIRYGKSSHRRKLMRFNSDGTVDTSFSPVTGSDKSNTWSSSRQQQSSPGGPQDTAGQTSPSVPDVVGGDVKVQRLRLSSQFMLFDKGRGSGAPVPIRIGEHRFKSTNPTSAGAAGQSSGIQSGVMSPTDSSARSNDPLGPYTESRYQHDHLLPLQTPPYSSAADYISNEQADLERAQCELDEEASGVEQRLRVQMSRNQNSDVVDRLLRRWFVLVNKKNALTRRGIQLSIMEREEDLQKKVLMLQNELHEMSKIEDYMKTDNDRKREELLLRDLVHLVNTRDDLIHQLDIQEQGLAEDLRLSTEEAIRLHRTDKGCILQ